MTAADTAAADRPSAEKASTDVEKSSGQTPVDKENQVQDAPFIPSSDQEYNVTFKTWIVVAVRLTSTQLPDSSYITHAHGIHVQ